MTAFRLLLPTPAWIVDVVTDASTSFVLGVSHAVVDHAAAEDVFTYDDERDAFIVAELDDSACTSKLRRGVL